MSTMASQILSFVNFTKTQKSKYVENETFSSNKKNSFFHLFFFLVKLENVTLILTYSNKLSQGV